jgi:signal peptidase I
VSLRTFARVARAATATIRRVVVALAVVVCVVGLGSVLGVSLANRSGYQVLGMKTGSMRPTIDPGDLVIARAVRPSDIRNGDVITFRSPLGSHAPYTHRVVRTTFSPDGPRFQTKGDANAGPDVWTVQYQAEGWRVVYVLRRAGLLLAFEQSPPGRRLLAASVFIVTVALLWPIFTGQRRAAEPEGSGSTENTTPQPEKVTA